MAKAAIAISGRDPAAGLRRAGLALMLGAGLWLGLTQAGRAEDTIVAHGVATLGTLSYSPDFTHLAYVNPEAPKGGEISEWTSGGFDNFNPYTLEGRAAAWASAAHESLLTGTADTVGEAYCLLCESVEYPASKDWAIFTLREGIRFSDGTLATTDDVVFSYETFRDFGLSSFRAVLAQQVASVEKLDDRRVKFTFQPGYPRRDIIQAAGGLPLLSRAQFERDKISLDKASDVPLIGTGPYKFGASKDGRSVSWVRNPDYWGEDLPINRGRNNFDTVRIEYFGDYNSAFEAFKAGAYTFRNEASSIQWATGYDFPAFTKGLVQKVELPSGDVASGQAFLINLRHPHLQDIRLREALGLAFNFEWSNATLFYGLYSRVNSIWENSYLAASGTPSAEELAILEPLAADLPDGILSDEAVMAPVSSADQFDRKNLRRAGKLLDEAGWSVGNDGLRRNAAGEVLRITILNDSQTFDRVINPFVENLRRIGIDAVHERVDDAQYENRRRSHDFDLITSHVGQDLLPGADLQQYFGSASVGDVFNAMGLANPAVDKMIRLVEEANTREELVPRVHALDRALRALRFWVPQWYKASHTVAYYDMFEHPEVLPPYALGETDFWWYNAEKAEKLKQAGAF
ncbi:extracellular solute-binding protein [Pseudothioclava arenosa]|uniref:ABC transporter substrate-binding protein n=1 Tax=Pseudothioclava arenosa TaxID=1795308 RepID=A0A2A4CSH0_9RHOB|nr:extracellular solute-binding protein [Pseudothioclava arenosa]PCD78181.1 ABC transporter substrate-binding protein [Pseudothioclava arenosa]